MNYAGEFLRDYENDRYSFTERHLKFVDAVRSIIVQPDAEQFADVSFYQAGMNWDTYQQNARAVILRIGQNIWKDTEWEHNYRETKKRELLVGGYFFYDGRVSPQQQMNVILEAMNGKTLEMELFIDWERNYKGSYEGLTNVVKLMKLCEAAGIKCKGLGLYTGYYWFIENSNSTTHAAEYAYLKTKALYLAWYAAASLVKIPAPFPTWTHWQFGTPVIPWGQPTAEIDMNKHNGTKAEFTQRYGGTTIPPQETENMIYVTQVTTAALNGRSAPEGTILWQGGIKANDLLICDDIQTVNAVKWYHVRVVLRNSLAVSMPAQVWVSAGATNGYQRLLVSFDVGNGELDLMKIVTNASLTFAMGSATRTVTGELK